MSYIRRWATVGAFLTLLVLGSCSWITNLVISNLSDDSITLEYFLKPHDLAQADPETSLHKGYRFDPPRLIPIDNFDHIATAYPEAAHSYDKVTGTVSVIVPPKTTVWVGSLPNYQAPWYERGASYLNISELKIRKKNTITTWQGVELMKAFKKYYFGPLRYSVYVLTLK
jgi:hypothetical protein